ncbi:hypothetical protein DVK44_08695 [Streptomyces paludis]|uniref:DUF1023 domain-containing protein n=1 Tax=Streptomyces paludis TaxID=2282738 RepID=A0A345I0J1_9ACTN|nr:hypothetical protein DVK44_08695 [Streptomyces paludis]
MHDAGDAWDRLARRFTEHAGSCGAHLRRGLAAENWGGLGAESAADRLARIRAGLTVAERELAAVGTVLRTAGEAFLAHQERLNHALADAGAAGYVVAPGGSVSAPESGPESGPEICEDHTATARALADRIDDALRAADRADREYAAALDLFTTAARRCAAGDWHTGFAEIARAGHLHDDLLTTLGIPPESAHPSTVTAWWNALSPTLQAQLIADHPAEIGNRDGIPATARDKANRICLPMLLDDLEHGRTDDTRESREAKIAGLKGIQRQLEAGGDPRPYLLGIGTEGNGRAIISFGNPDRADHVSAYVPGLNTRLEEHFATADVKRARDVAIAARRADPATTTASLVWLGYDAPQLRSVGLDATDVMFKDSAHAGASGYNQFLHGIKATHEDGAAHITALGHSYGSLTVGQASQQPGGIPADEVILVGSPGVGVNRARDLGVGADHVYVGAADNDQVTKLPYRNPLEYLAPGSEFGDRKVPFGTDPASRHFGGHHFSVEPGEDTGIIGLATGNTPAHSHYFDPEKGPNSLHNIANIVTGNGSRIKTTEPR